MATQPTKARPKRSPQPDHRPNAGGEGSSVLAASPDGGFAQVALALLATVLTTFTVEGGLLTVGSSFQTGLIGGLTAGILAPSPVSAIVVAVASGVTSVLFGQTGWQTYPSPGARFAAVVTVAIVSAAAAFVSSELRRRSVRWQTILTVLVVALIVANMWATTFISGKRPLEVADGQRIAPLWQQLTGERGHFADFDLDSDPAWYYRIYRQVHNGSGYYPAFAKALNDDPNWAPTFVTQFKMPLVFWFWSLFPTGKSIVIALLVLASIGVLTVLPIASSAERLALAVPACAALAAYFAFFLTTPLAFSIEIWGVPLALISLAAWVYSFKSARWRALTVVAVVSAVLGTLVRETLVFAVFGGTLSSLLAPRDQRPFRFSAWLVGVIGVGTAYGAHILAARPYIVPGPSQFAGGSLANAASALTYATDMIGGPRLTIVGLALIGMFGAALLRKWSTRAYAMSLTLVPLTSFLFVANRTSTNIGDNVINVWGVTVLPLIYALIPIGLAELRDARWSRTEES